MNDYKYHYTRALGLCIMIIGIIIGGWLWVLYPLFDVGLQIAYGSTQGEALSQATAKLVDVFRFLEPLLVINPILYVIYLCLLRLRPNCLLSDIFKRGVTIGFLISAVTGLLVIFVWFTVPLA